MVFTFVACGSSEDEKVEKDNIAISKDKTIIIYQHVDDEYCKSIVKSHSSESDGIELELFEYLDSYRVCEDYERKYTPYAVVGDKESCILLDVGGYSDGSCVLIASQVEKSNGYRAESYKVKFIEMSDLMGNNFN